MLTITEIDSAKLDDQIVEFAPIECIDCDFDQYISIQYYLVKPEIENEQQYNELKKLVEESIGFKTFAEMWTEEQGHIISVCRCPECGSEDIVQDF